MCSHKSVIARNQQYYNCTIENKRSWFDDKNLINKKLKNCLNKNHSIKIGQS
jgi:hypothetical protein